MPAACRGRLVAFDPEDGHLLRETLHKDAQALTGLSPSPQGSRCCSLALRIP